jgi:4-diphosphocytidyl-2-C-methyl-D-erythritol kinase
VSDMPAARLAAGASGAGAAGRARVGERRLTRLTARAGAHGRVAPVSRRAPAKLNLTLAVLGRREDGFHALHSVMVPLALADELSVRVERPGRPCSIRVEGLDVCSDPDNLVLRAILTTRDAVGRASPGLVALPPLAARLRKRIPVAAGLGGGSSDAAASIRAALEAWGAQLPAAEIEALGASLGSDVPFCLGGRPALVTGRGERVEPLPPVPGCVPAILLFTPRLALSTAAVFAAYDAGARPETGALAASERFVERWRSGDEYLFDHAGELAAANDLIPAAQAVAPALAGFRRSLVELLARPVGQSGSGPTLWAFCQDVDEARRDAALVRRAAKVGALACPGDGPPFVAVTDIASP